MHAMPDESEDREMVPRILLRAIAAFVLIVLALVTFARVTGMQPSAMPPKGVPVVQERTLHLFGEITGAVRVLDASGAVVADLSPDKGGFIAGVSRSLNLKRRQAGIDTAAPIRLIRFADGRLALRDDLTGWRAELIGFGKDNTAAFARLLED